MKRRMRVVSIILSTLVAATVLLSGCASREHIRPDYGEKTRAFYEKQRAYQDAAKEPPTGLDSEESAIIHGTYRKNLGLGADTEAKKPTARVLLVEDSED